MTPANVEHLVCATYFIHILALLTTNQISSYSLQFLEVNLGEVR